MMLKDVWKTLDINRKIADHYGKKYVQALELVVKKRDQADQAAAELASERDKVAALKAERLKISAEFDDETKKNIILRVAPHKDSKGFFGNIWAFIVGDTAEKVSGYIFHFNANAQLTIYDVLAADVDNLFKIKHKDGSGEAYMLPEYFGSWHGKKIFLVKYPHAISLSLVQEKFAVDEEAGAQDASSPQLAYDAKAYYNLLEHTIKRNITKGEGTGDILSILKQYWIYILIAAIGFILFFTPQGKEILAQLKGSLKM